MLHFWTNNPPLLCPGFPRFSQEFSRFNRKYLKNLSRRAYARRFLLIYRDCPLRGFAEAPHMLRVFLKTPQTPAIKRRILRGFCGIVRGFAGFCGGLQYIFKKSGIPQHVYCTRDTHPKTLHFAGFSSAFAKPRNPRNKPRILRVFAGLFAAFSAGYPC